MKIALIGWSGNDNWGDERMYYCIKRFFHQHKIVRFKSFLEAILNIDNVNKCDYVLIGGGGLIFRGFNRYSEFLQKITRPLGCIGISIEAEGLNNDMRKGLEILKEKADFIYVRDEKSREILQNHFKVITGPDIAFLYPYKPVREIRDEYAAVNLRNWFWWDVELHSWLHEKLVIWESRYPWIKAIYPGKTWDSDRLVTRLRPHFKKLHPFPLYFGSYDKTDVSVLKKYFPKVPKKFSFNPLSQSRYLIGMRLHSLIFATQMGIPFISLSYEPKNVNYCQGLAHPELSLPLLEYRQIHEKIDYLRSHYTGIRHDLLRYSKEAQRQASYIFKRIEVLMKQRVESL
jgi:polysaccharide pyruvyl transferase WcaK-like protein